jgi:hypothetical protein
MRKKWLMLLMLTGLLALPLNVQAAGGTLDPKGGADEPGSTLAPGGYQSGHVVDPDGYSLY